MSDANPVVSYDSVIIHVKMKRPRWSQGTNHLEDQLKEVTDYLTHHPEVGQSIVRVHHWECSKCSQMYHSGDWHENKKNAAECCYECED